MPTERAFTAASRLNEQYPDRPPEAFHSDELTERDLKQRGYLLLLFGAPFIGGGVLFALSPDGLAGGLLVGSVGVVLVVLGVRRYWQARGV